MPLLGPSASPPSVHHGFSPSGGTTQTMSSLFTNSVASREVGTPVDANLKQPSCSTTSERIPKVSLDVDAVTDLMAARLATCMLGHVLFLKNQVPFPVMQLARIRGSMSNPSAAKKRNELLNSFDTLSSHFTSTFTALSTALAHCTSTLRLPDTDVHVNKGEEKMHSGSKNPLHVRNKARAYIAILVGPSVGSAKAKIFFAVDGLEVKVWGQRDDLELDREEESQEEGEEDGDSVDDEGGVDTAEDGNDDEDAEDNTEDSTSSSSSVSLNSARTPSPISSAPFVRGHDRTISPIQSSSYVDDQQAFRVAERLLSRTLATADGEGHGMATEMAPTQTHILLRAPRRFVHPAWIPRQNMCVSLDGILREFLEASGMLEVEGVGGDKKMNKRRTGRDVEGVWVGCREKGESESRHTWVRESSGEEGDEMIWWSWDGRFVGFADW